ncbi:MAG: GNAT family N-acetyltransferase [Prevotella sp.]|nr:GNAT family N-acetyltransferase [Prevotella sp.]
MIQLRAIEPEDLDLLYTIENNRELWNIGATNVPYSRYVLHDYIAQSSGDIYTDRQVRLIIEAEGKTVGIIDLQNFSPRHNRAEVGIVVQKAWRRRGYALQAIQELASYARRTLHLHQLYAVVEEENNAARQLFEKAGFKCETTLKQWLYDGRTYRNARLLQIIL